MANRSIVSRFVLDLETVPASRYSRLNRIQRNRAFSVATVELIPALDVLKQELARVIEEGETARTFTARAAEVFTRFALPPPDKKTATDVLHHYSMLAYSYDKRQA